MMLNRILDDFIKAEHTECNSGFSSMGFIKYRDAKRYCGLEEKCTGFTDRKCNGGKFELCFNSFRTRRERKTYFETTSCAYKKREMFGTFESIMNYLVLYSA